MGKRGKTPNPLAPYACVAVHLVILVIIKALVLRSASKESKRFTVESLPEKVSAEGARQPSRVLRRALEEERVYIRDPEDAKGIVDARDCAAHDVLRYGALSSGLS